MYHIEKVVRQDANGIRKPALVEKECKKLEAESYERFEDNTVFIGFRKKK